MAFIDNMTREELIKLVRMYAKNWLAHDGCWFLAAEESFGMETAIDLDTKSWSRFAVAEAKRILNEFNIPKDGGLKSLETAMQYRLYAAINRQEIEWQDDRTMIFKMIECRVQKTRTEKNLLPFPCKSVGIVEFSKFAQTVDPRINTECIHCPPDPLGNEYCAWKFTMKQNET